MKLRTLSFQLTFFIGLSGFQLSAQTDQIDSLRQVYYQQDDDSLRWETAYELYQAFRSIQIDSAYDWTLRGHQLALSLDRPYMLGISHYRMGLAAGRKRTYQEAMDQHMQAIALLRPLGQDSMVIDIDYEIGRIYMELGEYAKAKASFDRFFEFYQEKQDGLSLVFAISNYSMLYEKKEQYDSVLYYSKLNLEVAEKFGLDHFLGSIHANVAGGYYLTKDYAAAIRHFQLALQNTSPENLKQQYYNYYGIGNTFYDLGQLDSCTHYYHLARTAAEGYGDIQQISDVNEWLADAYYKQQDYANAYHHLKAHKEAGDSLQQMLNDDALTDLRVQYDTQKKEAQIARQQLQLAEEANRRKILFMVMIAGLLLATATWWYRSKQQEISHRRTALELQMKAHEAERLKALDQIKSTFFANISHEFRTPLTLILGPLRQMYRDRFSGDLKDTQQMMIRNAERLLELINQLLNLSKLEDGQIRLTEQAQNLTLFIKTLAYSFETPAIEKQIHYQINLPETETWAAFDRDKLEKIISNLLSNALKFCPEKGRVNFTMRIAAGDTPDKAELGIEVSDNGPGIPEAELPLIFDRFYSRQDRESVDGGIGIGLALTRELVKLHQGKIQVTSDIGKGTTFTLQIPLKIVPAPALPLVRSNRATPTTAEDHTPGPAKEKPLVLIVEDNPDLRSFIGDQLKDRYQLSEARDGLEGLHSARETLPDLIITDVMMPHLDGNHFCEALKSDEKTSHIPIILLTARSDQEDKLRGLATGADAFITKPFDPNELVLRTARLIDQRKQLQQFYISNRKTYELTVHQMGSADEQFLQRCVGVVEEHLDDEDFGVSELGHRVHMSRSQLHRKIRALTDQSPSVFIRSIRLQHAYQLLEQKSGNISEIALEVGIPNLAYFSRCFSQEFGFPPSELLQRG